MKFTLDRVDEGIAVLITRDSPTFSMTVPASLLPPGCNEGDIVTLSLDRDEEATAIARSRVTDILNKLKKKP
jgi:hypothetical protein